MNTYWNSVLKRAGNASIDVLFVAVISLSPIFIGRFVMLFKEEISRGDYWEFLWNGQLSFFSMSSLATLLVYCFRKKLPGLANLAIGTVSLICFVFLCILVALDPTLLKAQDFVGPAALWIYIGVIIATIASEAIKAVDTDDALEASTKKAASLRQQLHARKAGGGA